MRRRGYSLLELLVVMVLILLVFTIAYQLLLPSFRIWRINQVQATLEESGLVIATKFVRDIEKSTQPSMTIMPVPAGPPAQALQAVAFATTGEESKPDSYDASTGMPLWQSYVIYFVPAGTRTLYRKIWPVPWLPANAQIPPVRAPYIFPNSIPVALDTTNLATLCAISNGTERSLGTCVDVFRIDWVTPSAKGSLTNAVVTVDLSCPSPKPGGLATSERKQEFHFWM